MGSGDVWDGASTIDGEDWLVPWGGMDRSGLCYDYNSKFWFAVKVYVGNSTEIDDATFCGYVSAETFIDQSSLTMFDTDTIMDFLKAGGSVKCPENVGSSQYVIFHFSDFSKTNASPCNIGIFSCECSNYEAVSRSEAIDGTSLDFVVMGQGYTAEALQSTDQATLVLTQSKTFSYPDITAYTECGSCSTRVIASYDESLEPYLDVSILQVSSTLFSITYTFELDTPNGDY